jgi:hypothetical protein
MPVALMPFLQNSLVAASISRSRGVTCGTLLSTACGIASVMPCHMSWRARGASDHRFLTNIRAGKYAFAALSGSSASAPFRANCATR